MVFSLIDKVYTIPKRCAAKNLCFPFALDDRPSNNTLRRRQCVNKTPPRALYTQDTLQNRNSLLKESAQKRPNTVMHYGHTIKTEG